MKTYNQFLSEALKRSGKILKFNVYHHGSDKDSISGIRKTGPRPSAQGSEGPGHYVTPDRKKAEKYSQFTSKQRGKEPGVVSYRVTPKKVQKVDAIPKGLTAQPKTSKQHPVVHNTRTGHAVMDAEFAKRAMIKKKDGVIKRR
jgi:hypothetical protein